MRQRTRKWLIGITGLAAFGTLCMLVGLRSGRPLFYTDGFSEWFAPSLPDAPMLSWPRPEPELELPGPVEGRVAELPDGRLIYGLVMADGTTDLVTLDPRRPGLPPEPVLGLNSRDHDLSPAMGADGTLYFVSDRRGGVGGFDIYAARYGGGYFGPPVILGPNINSPLDEADPAPDPTGDSLVFVRRDPTVNEGVNGLLYQAPFENQIEGEGEAQLVMPLSLKRDPYFQPMDRDPIFSPDGVHLWFVRSFPNQAVASQILSTWRHGDQYAGPTVHRALSSEAGLRSPTPLADGFGLRLVRPGNPGLLYVSRAHSLYPWWPGQQFLELVLLGILLSSLLLLLLLLLGQRWNKLDLITQCLLLSLLLHLLILLLLAEKELVRKFTPELPGEGALQVELLSGDRAESQGGGELAQVQRDLSAELRFQAEQRELTADVPEGEMESETAGARLAEGEMPEMAAPQQVAAEAAMQDQAAEMAQREGEDSRAAAQAQDTSVAAAQEAELNTQLETGDVASFQVTLPVTAPEQAQGGVAVERAVASGAAQAAAPEMQAVAASAPAPRDAPDAAMPKRSGRGELAAAVAMGTAAETDQGAAAVQAERSANSGSPLLAAGPARPTGLAANGARPMPVADTHGALPPSRQSGPSQSVRDRTGLQADVASLRQAGDSRTAVNTTVAGLTAATFPAALSATRSASTNGNGNLERVVVPNGGLATASRRQAPGSESIPMPRPTAGAPVGQVALRDPSAMRGADSSRGATEQSRAALNMATTAAATGRQDIGYRANRSPTLNARATTSGVPISTSLVDPARNRRGPQAQRSAAMPAARSTASPQMLALADAPRADTARAPAAATGGARRALSSGVVTLAQPAPAVVSRPERGPRAALGFDAISGGTQPPGSLMEAAPRRRDQSTQPAASLAAATPYSNRFGPAKTEALQRFGGTAETEQAVADGLRYLASIQYDRGHWGDRRRRIDKYGQVHLGKTGLALLAFLGAGHSPSSNTEYSEVTERAVRYLISQQDEDTGAIGETSSYSHGIATFALVECYGMTKDPALLPTIERALDWILENQSPRGDRRNRGGWGYFSTIYRAEDRYARTSITAWMVMALESARISGIEVADDVLAQARAFMHDAFDQDEGYYRYNHSPSRLNSDWPTLPASTPASAFALMLMGESPEDYRIRSALDFTVDRRPTSFRRFSDDDFVLRAAGNVYFWYYGSLACFLAGGDVWEEWNAALSTILPRAQADDGSFPPIDVYAEYAGDNDRDRSYTTAMCVLSLEVYYRYFTPLLIGR